MPSPDPDRETLAIVGGTGPEGRGLAMRLAAIGHPIIIGSRSEHRAHESAKMVRERVEGADVTGLVNEKAAEAGQIVVLTIPYSGISDTLGPLAGPTRGKIVVSAIAPVEFHEGRPVALRVEAGSAAEEVKGYLPDARVVSAFQTIDAHKLADVSTSLDTDVIVCSDDTEARRHIVRLASAIPGARGLSGGRLATSRYVEECTALLITMNRIYKVHSGMRITGVDR